MKNRALCHTPGGRGESEGMSELLCPIEPGVLIKLHLMKERGRRLYGHGGTSGLPPAWGWPWRGAEGNSLACCCSAPCLHWVGAGPGVPYPVETQRPSRRGGSRAAILAPSCRWRSCCRHRGSQRRGGSAPAQAVEGRDRASASAPRGCRSHRHKYSRYRDPGTTSTGTGSQVENETLNSELSSELLVKDTASFFNSAVFQLKFHLNTTIF